MTGKLKLRPGALEWRELDGEVVALDTRSSTYLAVSRSGAALWPALVDGATRDELVAGLLDRFVVDEATAAADVDAFVQALRDQDLLDGDGVPG
jgi:hypothetical protein